MGRNGSKPITQLQYAKRGVITDAVRRVAEREELPPEVVRDEVARGRMVVPAHVTHLAARPPPPGSPPAPPPPAPGPRPRPPPPHPLGDFLPPQAEPAVRALRRHLRYL